MVNPNNFLPAFFNFYEGEIITTLIILFLVILSTRFFANILLTYEDDPTFGEDCPIGASPKIVGIISQVRFYWEPTGKSIFWKRLVNYCSLALLTIIVLLYTIYKLQGE